MATNKKSTTLLPSMTPRQMPNVSMTENFHLVWLDGNIDEVNNDECRNSIEKLRQVIHTVNTFVDVDECIDYITDFKEEKAFMIISGEISEILAPIVQDIPQVNSVYIFVQNKIHSEKCAQQLPKVTGMYNNVTLLCEALKQTVHDFQQNSVSISIVKTTPSDADQNLDTLDRSFMYTQILKEILLTIYFQQEHTNEFLTYCREQFISNPKELRNIDKIELEYRQHQPIWWYTYNCFLYSMLNRALRSMEVELLIKIGFFVRDLHNHIAELHSEQYGEQHRLDPFIVYRGQGLSQTDLDQLKSTQDGLLAFNNFLSTSQNRNVSLKFARRTIVTSNLVGVLFVMSIDPSISATPFANIKNASYFQREEEILFSTHSVFRIGKVKQLENNERLWQVDLRLTGDHDPQLHALTKNMQDEITGWTGWHRLGKLLIILGRFEKAEELCHILFKQAANEGEQGCLFHILGVVKCSQGDYPEAIRCYEKSVTVLQKFLSPTDPLLNKSYHNLGMVYDKVGEYSKALSYLEKGLAMDRKTLSTNHRDLATTYNSIGSVYMNMGEYSKALSYYEQAIEIFRKTLPPNHPALAHPYNNIGLLYNKMGEYSKALLYSEKALGIDQKILPENHPDLADSYNSIGLMYISIGEYSKALSYLEKALKIREKNLPVNHPDLATSYINLGLMYKNMGEYSIALSYSEKALAMDQNTFPADHPVLANSYNSIALIYTEMHEYSKALSYYEKTLEIFKKTLPRNHPDMAVAYNNVGTVHGHIGQYSKALSYFEKALEIKQKTLSTNHPSLATSYNNIGNMYCNAGEYAKVFPCYEKALEILQKTLPSNHPYFATLYSSIGAAYCKMGEYLKALSYYEKAIEIDQKTFPAHHPDLAISYNNIALIYRNIGNYSKALSYYKRALDIFQRSLPSNHPHVESVKQGIEIVKRKL